MNNWYEPLEITLEQALVDNPTLLEGFIFDQPTQTQTFKAMFINIWNFYKLGGKDIAQFKKFITNKFNAYKPYYQQLIDVYYSELNYEDGIKTKETFEDDSTNNKDIVDVNTRTYGNKDTNIRTGSAETTFSGGNEETHYDLPRSGGSATPNDKTVTGYNNRKDTTAYNSVKDELNHTGTLGDSGRTDDDTVFHRDYTKIITGNIDVVELRDRYLKYLRDLYMDFAKRFSDCFNLVIL